MLSREPDPTAVTPDQMAHYLRTEGYETPARMIEELADALRAVPAVQGVTADREETVSEAEIGDAIRDAFIYDAREGSSGYDRSVDAARRVLSLLAPAVPKAPSDLTVRENPPMPSDEELHQIRSGAERYTDDFTAGLRAIWRVGCDAGMVAE